MSKIYILKPDAEPITIFAKRLIWSFKESEFCVPVDIDELYDDYNEYLADWLNKDTTGKDTYQSFSEYLQERMPQHG